MRLPWNLLVLAFFFDYSCISFIGKTAHETGRWHVFSNYCNEIARWFYRRCENE
jgi:hypothetical protein